MQKMGSVRVSVGQLRPILDVLPDRALVGVGLCDCGDVDRLLTLLSVPRRERLRAELLGR